MKLVCFVVGVEGSAFPVDIDDNQLVGDLKDAIKAKKMYQFPADKLQLFFAKKDNGEWLPSNDPVVIAMRSGAIPENMLNSDEIDPTEEIGDVFVPAPRKKQIHVLVVVPQQRPRIITNLLTHNDGIDPLSDHFDRQELLDRMYQWITGAEGKNRYLLLNSPPASGKTSLLVLFQHKYQQDLPIHYITFKGEGDPWQAFVPAGLNFDNRSCIHTNVIYLLDDAHCVYGKPDFWRNLIKHVPFYYGPGIRFIISATHMISSAGLPIPSDFQQLETIGRSDLILSSEQSHALLNSDPPLGFPLYLQEYSELKNATVEHCNGLIGALCRSVSSYGDQRFHVVPGEVHYLRLFHSKQFLASFSRCFGDVDNLDQVPQARDILSKCVLNESIDWPSDNPSLLDNLKSFAKAGILLSDGSHFTFSSLLAKRYFTNHYFPTRAGGNPSNLRELVMKAVGRMSAKALKLSTSRSADFPKEATFQHLFMIGLLCNTTPNTAICPELSRAFPTADQAPGEIDFFVDGGLLWGIELVRCGDKIGEHISRFSPTGKYSILEAQDYVVIDFRKGTTNVRQDSHRATVSFEIESNGETRFERATVKYGFHEPEDLELQP